jgi:nicotinate-nucleotide pyrophosphorylase
MVSSKPDLVWLWRRSPRTSASGGEDVDQRGHGNRPHGRTVVIARKPGVLSRATRRRAFRDDRPRLARRAGPDGARSRQSVGGEDKRAAGLILIGDARRSAFLQRMSGIATLTRRMPTPSQFPEVTLLDTRKTTPGLRFLSAPRCGGRRSQPS